MKSQTVTITMANSDPFLGMKVGDKVNIKIRRKWWQFWKKKVVRIYPLEISDMEEVPDGFSVSLKEPNTFNHTTTK